MYDYYVVKTKNDKFIALDQASGGYPYETSLLEAKRFTRNAANAEVSLTVTEL